MYFAAALFNTKECLFNMAIAKELENLGHKIYLPQRDGYNYGELNAQLPDHLSETEKSKAVAWIIYLSELGKVQQSSVILANMDEPLDPGVLIEIMYAKQSGIPTIGYRCDSRTPFGATQSWNFGMHFFPLFNCDYFISLGNVNTGSVEDSEKLIKDLAEQINAVLKDFKPRISAQKFEDIKAMASSLIPEEVMKLSDLPLEDLVEKYLRIRPKLE